jgi:hypothetical protein
MKRWSFLLLDANVIIALFKQVLWDRVVAECDLHRPPTSDGPVEPTIDDLSIYKLTPAYAPDGSLLVDFLLTGFASYADGDGIWGAYTRSAVVRSTDLPANLHPFRRLPEAVRWFFGEAPSGRFGWTAVASERRVELLALFSERKDIPGLASYSLHRT